MSEPDTVSIIGRLEVLAAAFDQGAVAVESGERTQFVAAGDPERLSKLTRLIEAGGRAMCFLFLRDREIVIQALVENESEAGTTEYMLRLREWLKSEMARDGLIKPARVN